MSTDKETIEIMSKKIDALYDILALTVKICDSYNIVAKIRGYPSNFSEEVAELAHKVLLNRSIES